MRRDQFPPDSILNNFAVRCKCFPDPYQTDFRKGCLIVAFSNIPVCQFLDRDKIFYFPPISSTSSQVLKTALVSLFCEQPNRPSPLWVERRHERFLTRRFILRSLHHSPDFLGLYSLYIPHWDIFVPDIESAATSLTFSASSSRSYVDI